MSDGFINLAKPAADVVVQLAHRKPGLMGKLMASLDKIDAEKAAEVRKLETFKAKSAINAGLARLREAAGPEAAAQFLRDTLGAIEGGGGEVA